MWGLSVNYHHRSGAVLMSAYQQLGLLRVAGTPSAFTGASGISHDFLIDGRYRMGDVTLAGGSFRIWHPEAQRDGRTVWIGGVVRFPRGVLAFNVQRAVQ